MQLLDPVERRSACFLIVEVLGGPKTRKAPEGALFMSSDQEGNGAGEGIRTLDPNLGKVVLYP